MRFKKPLIPTENPYVFHLAPIPVYQRVYDDKISDAAYEIGRERLNRGQKLMGQELPNRYDGERQASYEINYERVDEWVEDHEFPPIGSRFFTPPNNFLDTEHEVINIIKRRIFNGFYHLLDSLNIMNGEYEKNARITESWLQYYDPYSGRGHNAHNHCRWNHEETRPIMFSGGYYLCDGDPIADHPYSGVFSFHIRGMKHYIRPKRGMLIIWPYDIIHSVEPFYGSKERAVINFNIQI
jgi:hypothetical protein